MHLARNLRFCRVNMKQCIGSLWLLALAVSSRADTIQLNTGKALSGRVSSYADGAFELQSTNASPVKVPADTVISVDFSRGVAAATVELTDQKPLAGRIWLVSRGVVNLDDDKGATTRIPLARISRVLFSSEPVPERPVPPPRPRPAHAPYESPYNDPKIEVISHGETVDIQRHCAAGKITIVEFYADWCGPCRILGPKVEERVNRDPDLVLRKINIVDWHSPVCEQNGIRAIPFVQVYDRSGNKVGDMTGSNASLLEPLLGRAR